MTELSAKPHAARTSRDQAYHEDEYRGNPARATWSQNALVADVPTVASLKSRSGKLGFPI
jgi:hypothetical protein